MTEQDLKDQGYSVYVNHIRVWDGKRLYGKGGLTVVEINSPLQEAPVAVGMAVCSKHDNYNKKLGRTIALGRAICMFTGETYRRRTRGSWNPPQLPH
jgi:hypothetical protein